MYPNLLGQKEFFRLTEQDMGEIIGVSRFERQFLSGRVPGILQIF